MPAPYQRAVRGNNCASGDFQLRRLRQLLMQDAAQAQ
jgi:hypothetical protein